MCTDYKVFSILPSYYRLMELEKFDCRKIEYKGAVEEDPSCRYSKSGSFKLVMIVSEISLSDLSIFEHEAMSKRRKERYNSIHLGDTRHLAIKLLITLSVEVPIAVFWPTRSPIAQLLDLPQFFTRLFVPTPVATTFPWPVRAYRSLNLTGSHAWP